MINALTAQPEAPVEGSPVILMVSGGSDSMGLLVRAVRGELDLCDGRGLGPVERGRLCVLHVNHCLRGEASDGDETFVRETCDRLGVPVRVVRVAVGELGGNMEETARGVRYEAAWQLAGELAQAASVPRETARILVAHTADDRIETFFMRAITGAGSSGLTGMRSQRGLVVRPLLGETREQLRGYLKDQGFSWREDATNAEDDALRSYVRHHVVPAAQQRNPALGCTLGTALGLLADEDDLLDRLGQQLLESVCEPSGTSDELVLSGERLAAAEPAVARRAVRQGLRAFLGDECFREARFEARHIEDLLGLARCGVGSRTLSLGIDVRMDHGMVVVRRQGGRVSTSVEGGALSVPGTLAWGDGYVRASFVGVPAGCDAVAFARARALGRMVDEDLCEGRDFVLVDAEPLGLLADPEGSLTVGAPVAGERMEPLGMRGHSKLVADVLADAHVALRVRGRIPVVRTTCDGYRSATGSGVVWVGGIRLDARAAYRPETRMLVELTFWNPVPGLL